MNYEYTDLVAFTEERLSKRRMDHVLGVIKTAKELAKLHNLSVGDAEVAAILHDVAKEMSDEDLIETLHAYGRENYLRHAKKVWHAPAGRIVAQKELGIECEDLLNAIEFHTTGRPRMSTLEKIIYVADYIEPGRDFDGVEAVRELAKKDLEHAMHLALKQTVDKLKQFDADIHPYTLEAFDYYEEKLRGE